MQHDFGHATTSQELVIFIIGTYWPNLDKISQTCLPLNTLLHIYPGLETVNQGIKYEFIYA